jgi:hypothetical protein
VGYLTSKRWPRPKTGTGWSRHARVMGHTTVSTTMKYQHQNIDEVAEVSSHRVQ